MFDPTRLWPLPQSVTLGAPFELPSSFRLVASDATLLPVDRLLADLGAAAGTRFDSGASGRDRPELPLEIRIERDPGLTTPEAYSLDLTPSLAVIRASHRTGVSYALTTLAQAIALVRRRGFPAEAGGAVTKEALTIPALTISDHPCYRKRCFMVDLGRSVFSMPLLERIVRILALLKMNQLHLHLYDDELCGIRFPGLPFGAENPFAIELSDLESLIACAAPYGIEIVPELEGWGHVGSLVFHRPELEGGSGMYGGASFRIGCGSFDLMESLIDPVASILPDGGTFHLGLDEAHWYPADDRAPGYTPSEMVGDYWRILESCARRFGKRFDLRLWADHDGRPVPEAIREHLVIEPWQYWISHRDSIDRAIGRYSGAEKMRFMMGAGQSVAQCRGAFHATRYWARQAKSCPNVEGGNITFWGANNLDANFLSLFAGAYYLWNPDAQTDFSGIEDYETYDRIVTPIMRRWQSAFADARPDGVLADRGPHVEMGRYLWGPNHGEAVAPSASARAPAMGVG